MTNSAQQPLPGIEHVILLMFENRSFDNVLGALYPARPDGGGVPKGWSNPWPGSGSVTAWQAPVGSTAGIIPYPDPNELYIDMSRQIHDFGQMQGFVADYLTVPRANARDIMQFYRPDNVPVTAALAQTYMASDRYFASGPVQTWPNRLFSLCGTPGFDPSTKMAYLNNTEYPGYDSYPPIQGQLDYPSIFSQLDAAGKSWKVYFDDEEPIAALIEYVWNNWSMIECGGNVWPLSSSDDYWCPTTFFSDVAANSLPSFCLLEPRYQWLPRYTAPTSNHPGGSSATDDATTPINISCGERLLAQVYNALVAQPQLFAKTLLVVTYDEHGGLFDHVYPPSAVSPFSQRVMNFDYSAYGPRVPALFINPYVTQPGGLFRAPESPASPYPLDHTSLLATLRDQWNLLGSSQELSPRVRTAPTFAGLIDPGRRPIPAQSLPLPECTWTATVADNRPGHPMKVTSFRSTLRVVRRAERERRKGRFWSRILRSWLEFLGARKGEK